MFTTSEAVKKPGIFIVKGISEFMFLLKPCPFLLFFEFESYLPTSLPQNITHP